MGIEITLSVKWESAYNFILRNIHIHGCEGLFSYFKLQIFTLLIGYLPFLVIGGMRLFCKTFRIYMLACLIAFSLNTICCTYRWSIEQPRYFF